MGKPPSCFKIITCGGDSKDHNDVHVPENQNKGSSDKRGWSFRKKSAKQRVLSNSVITESPSSEVKGSFKTAGVDDFQQPANSILPEKSSATDCINEKSQLPSPEVPKAIDKSEDGGHLEESIAIVIQSAIRGLLAQIALMKLKKVVRLQAAVRGHLVRRHAVGTLRCVQAIVKMQALVRARRARQSSGGSHQAKLDGKHEQDANSSKTLAIQEKEEFDKSKLTYVSIEKLLSNRFALQLLDSTPKTTPINIKCDPLKPDSAWKWLERWMSVSSLDTGEQNKAEVIAEKADNQKEKNLASELDNGIDTTVCDSVMAISSCEKSTLPSEVKENIINADDEMLKVQACDAYSSLSRESSEQLQIEDTSISDMKKTTMEVETAESSLDQMVQSNTDCQLQCDYPKNHETEKDQPIKEGILSEQPETGDAEFVVGSRKATNPAFITAQIKFEELSSTVNSGTSLSFEENMESQVEMDSSIADTALETKEQSSSEIFSLPESKVVQFGGSECGTELSISSTLDSPERCDSGTFELEHERNVLVENIPDPIRSADADVEQVDDLPGISLSTEPQPILDEPKKSDVIISESIISDVNADPEMIEVKPDKDAFHQQSKENTETANQATGLSPETSPRSHITAPESQGTPSSQLSVNADKKVDKRGSNLKRKSLSVKKSPSNNIHDSGPRTSPNHLPKDQKIGKRRNSFGSARTDNIEQESRDSTSNNSLPHFMQATESARAKLHSNNSPRSSPDVQDRDIYIKKRHSLPGTDGRQGSPRIQRSTSQVPQSTKGNERQWQR